MPGPSYIGPTWRNLALSVKAMHIACKLSDKVVKYIQAGDVSDALWNAAEAWHDSTHGFCSAVEIAYANLPDPT